MSNSEENQLVKTKSNKKLTTSSPSINYEMPRPLTHTKEIKFRTASSPKMTVPSPPSRSTPNALRNPTTSRLRETKSEWDAFSVMEDSEDQEITTSNYVDGDKRRPSAFPLKEPIRDKQAFSSDPRSPPKVRGFENQVQLIKESLISESDFCNKYPHLIVNIDFQKFPDKRNYIAHEILTTEDTYVRNLEIAIQIFKVPIQLAWEEGFIRYPKLKRLLHLFRFMSDILGVNQELLKDLKERFQNWSEEQKIGDVILSIIPFLKMYREYTDFFDKIPELLEKAKLRDKYFAAILEAARTHPLANAAKLESFLILPVQRIPRYVLLLTDLINNTPQTHPDYKQLHATLNQIKEVAVFINNAAKLHEGRQKCIEIEKLFSSVNSIQLVEVHRTFVYEGILTKQCRKDRQPRGFFLFNDILLYGHPYQGKYIFPTTLNLESVHVEDVPDKEDSDIINSFNIKAQGKSFQVFAETPESKKIWISQLIQTINEQKERVKERKSINEPSGSKSKHDKADNAAPLWIPDASVDKCPLCKNKFTIIFRKHHCRKCGQIVCGDCSNKKMVVPSVKSREVRVCEVCYNQGNSNNNVK